MKLKRPAPRWKEGNMPRMTIEAQLQHIAEYRRIIDSLEKRRPLAEYNKLYIIDLERSIKER